MNIQADRALIPAGQVAIRYLTIAIPAPAHDARLVIEGATGIDIGCINDLRGETVQDPVTGHADAHILLGDLVSAQEMRVAIAVRCPAAPAGSHAGISLRLTDRDGVLFPQPMPVDWRVVDAVDDAAQPVNTEVIVEVATIIAARARAGALEARRRGDVAEALAILQASAADLRRLGAGIADVRAIADALEAGPPVTAALGPLAPVALPRRHGGSSSAAAGGRRKASQANARPSR